MQKRLGIMVSLKHLLLPKNNHWLKRTGLVFAFILFDYLSTLVFCRAPHEEANLYARAFMENTGIFSGLTLFVLVANLPIYMVLSLDSHIIKLPSKISIVIEPLVDVLFAWFIAGLHFSGGTSWFWLRQDSVPQAFGALLYLTLAFLIIKPHKLHHDDTSPISA